MKNSVSFPPGANNGKIQFESVSENHALIPKDTLEKLIRLAKQVGEIEINEIRNETKAKRGSLQGIWKGSQISEEDFLDARRALFSYEDAQWTE